MILRILIERQKRGGRAAIHELTGGRPLCGGGHSFKRCSHQEVFGSNPTCKRCLTIIQARAARLIAVTGA